MAMTPEAKVKSDVQRYLHEKGFIRAGSAPKSWPDPVQGWYFMPSQNGRGVTGIPDFVGCYKGRFFSVETKAPGKRNNTNANQDQRIKEIQRADGVALVVDDVEQLKEVLEDVVQG